MFSTQEAEVSLNVPIRAMDALRGDSAESRFVVGSCSMDNLQHLLLLRFHSDYNRLRQEAILEHPSGSVASISTSTTDRSMVLTTSEDGTVATLWKIPGDVLESMGSSDYADEDDDNDIVPEQGILEERATLSSQSRIVDTKWRGGTEDDHASPHGDVLTLDANGNLKQWDAAFGAAESTRQIETDISQAVWSLPPRMAWDPHAADVTAVAAGTHVSILDWRDSSENQRFGCHRYGMTSLDYNPNKPHTLVTSGQDALLKFWDLRSHKQPLLTVRGGHRHWTTQVQYNPFHDQLVLSAGTDSVVNLWRISSISSAPLLTLDDEEDDNQEDPAEASSSNSPNVRVSRLEHMDSVYATAWSAADAWIYASASYDGKVVLNHVPSNEKYKILL